MSEKGKNSEVQKSDLSKSSRTMIVDTSPYVVESTRRAQEELDHKYGGNLIAYMNAKKEEGMF